MKHPLHLQSNGGKSYKRQFNFQLTALLLILISFFGIQTMAQGTWTKVAAPSPDKNFGNLIMLSDGSALCKSGGGGGLYWLPLSSTTVLLSPAIGYIGCWPLQYPGPSGIFPSHEIFVTKSLVYSISFSAIFLPSSNPSRVSLGNARPAAIFDAMSCCAIWFTESAIVG